jgi:acetyl-CoA carboxylase biotin carboxyl carrier protein
MIDLRFVKKLVDMIDNSTVDSIEITSDKGMKIRISKNSSQRATVQLASPMQLPPMMQSAPPQVAADKAPAAEAPRVEKPKATYLEVKSPMVGTYYGAPEPGARPYLAVGDRISKGQILCIIEAMKIMNEIEAEIAGVVREISVEDGQPVEFGQALFRVDPNG